MTYRIVRATNLYPAWIKTYYAAFPGMINKPFAEQYDHLTKDAIDVSSSFTKRMNMLGMQAYNIFTNAQQLQNQWALENNCSHSGKELIFEQLKMLKPEIIWLDDTNLINQRWISHVRSNIPSVKLVTGHSCAPYHADDIRNYKALDFLFTCTPCYKSEFEKKGIKTYLLYHSFESSLISRLRKERISTEIKLLFSGSLFTGGGFHRTRIEYLETFLAEGLPLKIYGQIDSRSKLLSKFAAHYAVSSIRKLGGRRLIHHIPILRNYEAYGDKPINFYSRKLRANLFAPVFGIDQLKLLSSAQICFNIHLDDAKLCAGNMRLFEATGVGNCLVTDWKENLNSLFEPEKEVVTYKTVNECVDKVKWLLQNPAEADKIAKAGHARTMRDHTVEARVNSIHEILSSHMKRS